MKNKKLTEISVYQAFDDEIMNLNRSGRYSTAMNYIRSKKSLSMFLDGKLLNINDIDRDFILRYEKFLINKGLKRNSISFYMRGLRAVYNKVVRKYGLSRIDLFEDVYTGVDYAAKRAVRPEIISELYRLDLASKPKLDFARDLFIFSFLTRGMAFIDIANLKKENILNGNIVYKRHKTNIRLCVRIEKEIQRIINKYQSHSSEYIFPILNNEQRECSFHNYFYALNNQNRYLRKLSSMINSRHSLSTYTPRHSWATIARNSGVPINIISDGLGHTSERTTRIYLGILDNVLIDKANRLVMDTLV